MQSVTAYYVIVALDQARGGSAMARAGSTAPTRPSRLAGLVAAFAGPIRRRAASAA